MNHVPFLKRALGVSCCLVLFVLAQALRQLASTRPSWSGNFATLSPSQFAFFLRDRIHMLLRLEYLVVSGGGKGMTLRDVMKMTNQAFIRCAAPELWQGRTCEWTRAWTFREGHLAGRPFALLAQ